MFNLFGKKKVQKNIQQESPQGLQGIDDRQLAVAMPISEPVLTIARLFSEDYDRFEVQSEINYESGALEISISMTWTIKDKKTDKSFVVRSDSGFSPRVTASSMYWMTQEERLWLGAQVVEVLNKKAVEEYEKQRKVREELSEKERAEWLDAYKDDM